MIVEMGKVKPPRDNYWTTKSGTSVMILSLINRSKHLIVSGCTYIAACSLPAFATNDCGLSNGTPATSCSTVFTTTYNQTQNLSFQIDEFGTLTIADGTIEGDVNVNFQVTNNPACQYVQLSIPSLTISVDGTQVVTLSNLTTPWCQYMGVELTCPLATTGDFTFQVNYGIEYDGVGYNETATVTNNLGISLDVAAWSGFIPSVNMEWNENTTVDLTPYIAAVCFLGVCTPAIPATTVSGGSTITFPVVTVFPEAAVQDSIIGTAIDEAFNFADCSEPGASKVKKAIVVKKARNRK